MIYIWTIFLLFGLACASLIQDLEYMVFSQCGRHNKPVKKGAPHRIIGGSQTGVNEYPFMARLTKSDFTHICGASIISPLHILTAAHCVARSAPSQLLVVVGDHNRQILEQHEMNYSVYKTVIHKDYNGIIYESDIAILLLTNKIKFNKNVGPVCMPTGVIPNIENEEVRAIGWGAYAFLVEKESIFLQHISVIVKPSEQCHESAGKLCVEADFNKDVYKGDSGGPFVWWNPKTDKYTLIGITSYGNAAKSIQTDVLYYMDWIKDVLAESGSFKRHDSSTTKYHFRNSCKNK